MACIRWFGLSFIRPSTFDMTTSIKEIDHAETIMDAEATAGGHH